MGYGLIGEKLGHSYSKIIHEKLGKYSYDLIPLSPEELTEFISGRKYNGLNVTIPYKKAVMPLCDHVSELAREIGAVNTLYFKDGELWGTNTDYQGFLYAAQSAGISFQGKKVLILGNGGTSLMIQKAVRDQGAVQVVAASRSGEPGTVLYDALPLDAQVIINSTPVGTYPNNGESLISLSDFPHCCGIIDVIYNPLTTDLLRQAQDLNIAHSNGLPMLVAQATAAAEHFINQQGLQNENEDILSALRHEMENIVLIGMPGCGKSSLGQYLADHLGKEFVDMDEEIEHLAGASIKRIFASHGEPTFRDFECQIASQLGKERGQVIATGGGVVLRPENIRALSQNGTVIFIRRPLEHLEMSGRPLSKDLNTLKTMYETRLPLYNKYSQLTFDTLEGIEESGARLLSLLKA